MAEVIWKTINGNRVKFVDGVPQGVIGKKIVVVCPSKVVSKKYKKHGAEFGSITRDEYKSRASVFLNRVDVETIKLTDGKIIKYDKKDNEYGVSKDGEMITYYKPKRKEKHLEAKKREWKKAGLMT